MVYSNIDLYSITSICSLICDYMETSEFIEMQDRYITLAVPLEDSIYKIILDPSITKKTGIYSIEFCCIEPTNNSYVSNFYMLEYNFNFNLNVTSYFFKKNLIDFKCTTQVNYQITIVKMDKSLKSLHLELLSSRNCRVVLALNKDNCLNHVKIYMDSYISIYDINNRIDSNLNLYTYYNESLLIYKNCCLNIDMITKFLLMIPDDSKEDEIAKFIKNNNFIFTPEIILYIDDPGDIELLDRYLSLKSVFIKNKDINKKLIVHIEDEKDIDNFISLLSSFNDKYGFNQFKDFHLKVHLKPYSLHDRLKGVQKLFLDCYIL